MKLFNCSLIYLIFVQVLYLVRCPFSSLVLVIVEQLQSDCLGGVDWCLSYR